MRLGIGTARALMAYSIGGPMAKTLRQAYEEQWQKRMAKRASCRHAGVTVSHAPVGNRVVAIYKCPSCKAVEYDHSWQSSGLKPKPADPAAWGDSPHDMEPAA